MSEKGGMMSEQTKNIEIIVVPGVEGPSLYINSYRIAGPKPWGGGKIINKWKISKEDFINSLIHLGFIHRKRKKEA